MLTLLLVACLTPFEIQAPLGDRDGDGVAGDLDCDDTRAGIYPGATETCDGLDQDCDGRIDEGAQSSGWVDMDGDGWGSGESVQACEGLVDRVGDCQDGDPEVYPGAEEICDGLDQDCDDSVDEGILVFAVYRDDDGDGYGLLGTERSTCAQQPGWVENKLDCDDADSGVNPSASETCDGVDQDCDGYVDGWEICECEELAHESVALWLCTLPMGWPEALATCRDQGSELLSVHGEKPNERLYEYIDVDSFWIGLNDRGTEGDWEWSDGSSLDLELWGAGEPNDAGPGEDCVEIGAYDGGRWNDRACGDPLAFVCSG